MKRPLRRFLLSLAALVLFYLLLSSCFPGPVKDLWPPRPGEPRYPVDVLYSDWHTFIVQPAGALDPPDEGDPAGAEGEAAGPAPAPKFFEWEFAEKAWYLDGRQGITGVFRALCWPTRSALSRKEVQRPFWDRRGPPDMERWTFVLSREGLERMVRYAEAMRGEPISGRPGWYAGKRSYHLFFLCHHFTLSALREAGLPVAPWWGYTAWMTEIQLDRVKKMHARHGLVEEASPEKPEPSRERSPSR